MAGMQTEKALDFTLWTVLGIILGCGLFATGPVTGLAPGALSVARAEPPPAPPWMMPVKATIIPWMEVPSPDSVLSNGTKLGDQCLQGLQHWSRVTDTAIVTTTLHRIESFYPDLMASKPPCLCIVGGLKTNFFPGVRDDRPYDYADAGTWRQIAKAVARIAEITGTKAVVLENETALAPFHRGEAGIDYDKLRHSLIPLRDVGVTVWWALPAILDDTPSARNRQASTTRLVQTIVKTVPNSVFLPAYAGWHGWRADVDRAKRRQLMARMVGCERLHEMLYVRLEGQIGRKRCYRPSEVDDAMSSLLGHTFILYPGALEWKAVAQKMATPGA